MRVHHWLALAGLPWVVLRMTACTVAAEILGVRPGLGTRFCNPETAASSNLLRRCAALWGEMFSISAISLSCCPAAAIKTIRARCTTRTGNERTRDGCSRVCLVGIKLNGPRDTLQVGRLIVRMRLLP